MTTRFGLGHLSVPGVSHRRVGKECQDSLVAITKENLTLLLVSDGLGAVANSKVGSVLLSQMVRRMVEDASQKVAEASTTLEPLEFSARFTTWLNRELPRQIGAAKAFLGDTSNSEEDGYMLATLVGAIITDSATVIFGCGDGIFAIDGKVSCIDPKETNVPDLPVYALRAGSTEQGRLRVFHAQRTSTVSSVLIGTDGAMELLPTACCVRGDTAPTVEWLEGFFQRTLAVSATAGFPQDDAAIAAAWKQ